MTSRLILAAFVVAAAGCSSDQSSNAALSVAYSVAPAPNATSVPRTSGITMDAPLAMDSASCINRMVLHMGTDTTGPVVPTHMTFENNHQRIVLHPDSMLQAMTTYTVHMRDSMLGADMMTGSGGMMGGTTNMHPMILDQVPAGAMRMSAGMRWTFTTGS